MKSKKKLLSLTLAACMLIFSLFNYSATQPKAKNKNILKDGKFQIEFLSEPIHLKENFENGPPDRSLDFPGIRAIVNEWRGWGASSNEVDNIMYYVSKMQLKKIKGKQPSKAEVSQLFDNIESNVNMESAFDVQHVEGPGDITLPTLNGRIEANENTLIIKERKVVLWTVWVDDTTLYRVKVVYPNTKEDQKKVDKIKASIKILK